MLQWRSCWDPSESRHETDWECLKHCLPSELRIILYSATCEQYGQVGADRSTNSTWHRNAHKLKTFDENSPFSNCREARTTYERICWEDKADYRSKVVRDGQITFRLNLSSEKRKSSSCLECWWGVCGSWTPCAGAIKEWVRVWIWQGRSRDSSRNRHWSWDPALKERVSQLEAVVDPGVILPIVSSSLATTVGGGVAAQTHESHSK